jgi:hypothetical protein
MPPIGQESREAGAAVRVEEWIPQKNLRAMPGRIWATKLRSSSWTDSKKATCLAKAWSKRSSRRLLGAIGVKAVINGTVKTCEAVAGPRVMVETPEVRVSASAGVVAAVCVGLVRAGVVIMKTV